VDMSFENLCFPDLSNLNVPLKKYLIVQVLVGLMGTDKKGLYAREYIRLVDKAVYEYELARLAVEEQRRDRAQLHFLRFIDHFETCINAMARLLKLLDRLKAALVGNNTTRRLRKQIDARRKAVRDVRGEIEHMDKIIAKGNIQPGKPVMLRISEDGKEAIVGNYHIGFADVSRCLRSLHQFGVVVLQEGSEGKIPLNRECGD